MPQITPAKYVVRLFGGIRPLARALKMSPGSICYWLKPKTRGGAGGRIPSTSHAAIRKAAEKAGLELSPTALITPTWVD